MANIAKVEVLPAVENEEWYQQLLDDCQTIITETEFTARWVLVEGYHTLGLRILEDEPKIKRGGSDLRDTLTRVSKDIGTHERQLYRAVQFARKCPDLELLPYGKDVSWRKICHEYLPALTEGDKTPLPLPKGKFRVIEADPPWQLDAAEGKSAVGQYRLMTLEEIKDLAVADLAADDCHLYLWAINPMLPEALEVIDAWGFIYKTCITWVKSDGFGTGHYFRGQTEQVLFAIKGKLDTLENDQPNFFEAPRKGRHSEKPNRFYEIAERMSPEPRVRLFARSQRDGWVSWGDEI